MSGKSPSQSYDLFVRSVEEVLRGKSEPPDADGFRESGVIGVSGGVDSMVLLHVLSRLRVPLTVAHVNYHLRGADSNADEVLVSDFAQSLGLPFYTHHADPDAMKDGNLQDNARRERQQFWLKLAVQEGFSNVYLAHHRDDHVETIFQRILRGAGPTSLHGMLKRMPFELPTASSQPVFFCRPLLDVTRAEIEMYAQNHNIPYRNDASNAHNDYTRNWLRNQIGPRLDTQISGWRENLIQVAKRSLVTADLIEARLREHHATPAVLPLSALSDIHRDTALSVIHSWLGWSLPQSASEGLLQEVFRLITAQPGTHVPLIRQNCEIWREGAYLRLITLNSADRSDNSATPSGLQETPTSGSNVIEINANGCTLHESDVQKTRGSSEVVTCNCRFATIFVQYTSDVAIASHVLKIDDHAITWPLTLRTWQPSDRIQPLGFHSTVLVSDLLTNKKVRPSEKKHAIVVRAFDGKICAVIFPHPAHQGQSGIIAEHAKLHNSSALALQITIRYSA